MLNQQSSQPFASLLALLVRLLVQVLKAFSFKISYLIKLICLFIQELICDSHFQLC